MQTPDPVLCPVPGAAHLLMQSVFQLYMREVLWAPHTCAHCHLTESAVGRATPSREGSIDGDVEQENWGRVVTQRGGALPAAGGKGLANPAFRALMKTRGLGWGHCSSW